MSTVQEYLDTAVHFDSNETIQFTNISKDYGIDEDFEFKVHSGESDAAGVAFPPETFKVGVGETVHFPKSVGMNGVIDLARKLEYHDWCFNTKGQSPSSWKGSDQTRWVPIADKIIAEKKDIKADIIVKPVVEEVVEETTIAVEDMTYDELKQTYSGRGLGNPIGKKKDELIKALS